MTSQKNWLKCKKNFQLHALRKNGFPKSKRKSNVIFQYFWLLLQNFARIKFKIPHVKLRILQ